MIKRFCSRLLILALLLVSGHAIAAIPQWVIVSDKSTVSFTATQNNAPVTGVFKHFTGTINFDLNQLNASHVNIIVDTDSVTTSYSTIADTLKTTDWFNVSKFLHATFIANDFKKIGENKYQANGKLTIRDKQQPVSFEFIVKQATNTQAVVSGTATIKRTMFGVGQGDWASTDSIKDDVTINFTLTVTKK